jgi:hypothetical protein
MNCGHFKEFRRGLLPLVSGVLFACVVMPGAAFAAACLGDTNPNLVRNGGFESGIGTDIKHWTVAWDSTVDPYVYLDTTNPHSGAQDLAMGSTRGANDITQGIQGTVGGYVYTVCFWLYSSPNLSGGHTSFEILWNNVPELELINSARFGYEYYALNVLAQGNAHDALKIRERNYEGFYYLDDVAVQLCSGCGLAPDSDQHMRGKRLSEKSVE